MDKPNVLILGGCGFIGRHLVCYLIENELVARIRIVDKTPPQMAWLNEYQQKIYGSSIIEFRSANLRDTCKTAFASDSGIRWDFVFNCAGETRPGQTEPVYVDGIIKLSRNCAEEAANQKVKRFIEFSSGDMYPDEKQPQLENCSLKPSSMIGKCKAKVEDELSNIANLNYTILRLPIVYGIGDKNGLTPRILIAGLYKVLGETMKLLWTENLKMNTVHVLDAVSAAWHFANNEDCNKQIINVVDDSISTQGIISNLLADIYEIKVDYWGQTMSHLAKANMGDALEEINEKHLGPWAELCQRDNVTNTPLTPYMYEDMINTKHIFLSNTKMKQIGYQLRVPKLTKDYLIEIIRDFVKMRVMPHSLNV